MSKRFDDDLALDRFDLEVATGHIVTLLGPSGSGKTTALRLIAGFDRPNSGSIDVGGVTVSSDDTFVAPESRKVGMVFQDYALFPHLTVSGNIGYGVDRETRRGRVPEMLELVGLGQLGDRMPHELSGGEQQRVALARALAPKPNVILLDEPFSNLDAALRSKVRTEIAEILRTAGTTAVFVTHDQEEALSTSDSVAVMREGRVIQAASPDDLYRKPVDEWVAGFLGDADFFTGHATAGRVETPVGSFPTDLSGPVRVMVRPESVVLSPSDRGDAVVRQREFFGHDQLVTLALSDGSQLRARIGPTPHFELGDSVSFSVERATTFPANGSAPHSNSPNSSSAG